MQTPLVRALTTGGAILARPYLRLHLKVLGRKIRRSPFPVDAPPGMTPGAAPVRLAVIGELAASGYGVLLSGMALPAQLAATWSHRHDRGTSWRTLADPLLTARGAARHPDLDDVSEGAHAVAVALGVPDVLLATSVADFSASVEALIVRARGRAGLTVPIVLAGLPPMTRFQPLPPVALRVIGGRMRALDDALRLVAARDAQVTFVPFPDWHLGRMYVRDAFSFAAMHQQWGAALAAELPVPARRGPVDDVAPAQDTRADHGLVA